MANTDEIEIKEILTLECVEVLLSGISWKYNEGSMTGADWRKVEQFLKWAKEQYPELAEEYRYLFD